MNNPNLTLENAIRTMTDQMRKETQELDAKRQELERLGGEDTRLKDEIKRDEDAIKAKMTEIGQLKQQISNDTRKIEVDRGVEHKLQQEIDTEKRHQAQNAAKLAESQREYQDSLKQSGVKLK